MGPLEPVITTLGLAVGMMLICLIFLCGLLGLLHAIGSRFTGWNETGYKRRLCENLLEINEDFLIGTEAGLMANYIRTALINNEPVSAWRARDYFKALDIPMSYACEPQETQTASEPEHPDFDQRDLDEYMSMLSERLNFEERQKIARKFLALSRAIRIPEKLPVE